ERARRRARDLGPGPLDRRRGRLGEHLASGPGGDPRGPAPRDDDREPTMDRDLHCADRRGDPSLVRVAAVGDLHVAVDSADVLSPLFRDLTERADALLLAGDLTQHGLLDEGRALAAMLSGLTLPVIAVLGNHDYHRGYEDAIRAAL